MGLESRDVLSRGILRMLVFAGYCALPSGRMLSAISLDADTNESLA
jgi:hypothetical protein